MTKLDFAWALTGYVLVSFVLFLATSFTTLGWILYVLILLPIYAVIVLARWLSLGRNHGDRVRTRIWIWPVVLVLQVAVLLTSPGNCYGWSQGDRCYSNLQIVMGQAPRSGPSKLARWKPVENSFHLFILAYGASLALAVSLTGARER
jgi:hypothetical protein